MTARPHIFVSAIVCFLMIALAATAQEGRIITEKVYFPSLEGNLLGDSPEHSVSVYLPPSYDTEPDKHYPVVYLLHRYTGLGQHVWLNGETGDFPSSMDGWVKSERVKEMIIVMPNSVNMFLASFHANSVTTGNWADQIAIDMVNYADTNYRTIPQRDSRGLLGHFMGGYGAMSIGLANPDTFCCMGSMSGLLDLTQYLGSISWAFADAAELDLAKINYLFGQHYKIQIAVAVSAAFCPNPDKPIFYADFPWIYDDSGNIVRNQDVWDTYMEHDVLTNLASNTDALSGMKAIYIDCGKFDSDGLLDAQRVHDELDRLNISHNYREYNGDHFSGIPISTMNALELFSNAMAFEMTDPLENPSERPSPVHPQGKLAVTWANVKSQ